MGKASDYIPALRYGHKIYPENLAGVPIMTKTNNYWFVDGGIAASGGGKSWENAFKTIGEAVSAASAWDVIFVAPLKWSAGQTDPDSYAETFTIPLAKSNLQIIGVGQGRVQGGLPQMKINTGSTAMITINAPACRIANMGINGVNSTGGGILLEEDGGATKTSFGTTIENCHFKNCVGSDANNASGGGAITITGGPSQLLFRGNKFYKNVGDICLIDTSFAAPQDVVIEDNIFSGPAASVNMQLYLKAGGTGINGVYINNCVFPALGTKGTLDLYMDLTGCVGILSNCTFASVTNDGDATITFAAAGTGAYIPDAVFICNCFGESATTAKTAEIFRT